MITIERGILADGFYVHSETALAKAFADDSGDLKGGTSLGGIGNQDFLIHGILFSEGSVNQIKFGRQGGEVAKSAAGEGRSTKGNSDSFQKVAAGEFSLGHVFSFLSTIEKVIMCKGIEYFYSHQRDNDHKSLLLAGDKWEFEVEENRYCDQ